MGQRACFDVPVACTMLAGWATGSRDRWVADSPDIDIATRYLSGGLATVCKSVTGSWSSPSHEGYPRSGAFPDSRRFSWFISGVLGRWSSSASGLGQLVG